MKKHLIPSHFTNYLANTAFLAVINELGKEKYDDPLDGDETEAIAKKFLKLLDDNQGNK